MFKFSKVALAVLLTAPILAQAKGPKAPAGETIYDTAVNNGSFTVLVDALDATGLDAVLAGDGQYTVFAPVDSAFPGSAADVLAVLAGLCGAGNELAALENILLYHVTDGRRFSNSVVNRNNSKPIEMLNGSYVLATPQLTVIDEDGNTGDATIVDPDINATNGVIHVIDEVLFPATVCPAP